MVNIDPNLLGPDKLFLSGMLQVDTAIEVLEMTGVSSIGLECLRGYRSAYEGLPELDDEYSGPMVFLSGGPTKEIKTAIITSALLVEANEALSDLNRSAAAGLLSVLGVEK